MYLCLKYVLTMQSRTIWVELFNATGDVIHRDNKVNYWLEVTKEYTDAAGKPQKEVTKVSVDNFELQGNTQPIDRNWGYARLPTRWTTWI